ncbi:MAG: radical SAM protein [Candidatus Omnitrophica bacterium]|nr:radical SAM protein [Candidatus Omnitrophota bacterium]
MKKVSFARRYQWVERNPDQDGCVPLPLVYKLMLTFKCNLKCKVCMLWGEKGWCKDIPAATASEDLDWDIVKNLIEEHTKQRPSFILTGGEPLLYQRFPDLAALLKRKRLFATICTNGLLIEKHQKAIEDNHYLIWLLSLDGNQEINDRLRGGGVYERVVKNIHLLKSFRKSPYVGVQFTIQPENVSIMYDFCKDMVRLGVDWVLLNPRWFVSDEQAAAYKVEMRAFFSMNSRTQEGYQFPVDIDQKEFVRQLNKIRDEKWPIQISSYLQEPEDIYPYMNAPAKPIRNRLCYKQWLRFDVLPSGEVTPCIQFPDLILGSLKKSDLATIWNSSAYENFRKKIRKAPLSVCSKCNNLYLYDAKRASL